MDTKTVQHYNQEAESIAKLHASLVPHRIYELAHRYFTKGSATVDIGCGIGRDSHWLNSHDFPVIGVDASEGMLKQARQMHPKLEFILDGLPTLANLNTSKFKNILCSAVLMHLNAKSLIPACFRLVELLEKDGHLIISIRATDEIDGREHGKLYEFIDVESLTYFFEENDCNVLLYESAIEQKRQLTWHNLVIKK